MIWRGLKQSLRVCAYFCINYWRSLIRGGGRSVVLMMLATCRHQLVSATSSPVYICPSTSLRLVHCGRVTCAMWASAVKTRVRTGSYRRRTLQPRCMLQHGLYMAAASGTDSCYRDVVVSCTLWFRRNDCIQSAFNSRRRQCYTVAQ